MQGVALGEIVLLDKETKLIVAADKTTNHYKKRSTRESEENKSGSQINSQQTGTLGQGV